MYNEFQNPRLAEALRRGYGEQLEISTFAPELAAHIILENDRFENRILQGLRYWSTGSILIGASVGNLSRMQIHNPPNSNTIVVVLGFIVTNPPTAGSYAISRDGALAGTPTQNLALDTRVVASTASRKVASLNRIDNSLPGNSGEVVYIRQAAAIGADVVFNFDVDGGGPEQPIVLVPNTVCEIINQTGNQLMRCVGIGYERPARPEEFVVT